MDQLASRHYFLGPPRRTSSEIFEIYELHCAAGAQERNARLSLHLWDFGDLKR
jgi:hypothetical protein